MSLLLLFTFFISAVLSFFIGLAKIFLGSNEEDKKTGITLFIFGLIGLIIGYGTCSNI